MSEPFDITKILEGMTPEQGVEFVASVLTPEAKQAFLAKKQTTGLHEKYQAEMNALNLNGLSMDMKVRKMEAVKRKYRAQGLEVY